MFEGKSEVEKVLAALAEQLETLKAGIVELVVCGGAALNVLGFIRRTTKDLDIIAYIERKQDGTPSLIKADKLMPVLTEAAKRVAKDFNLPENWLNTGPASVMDFGLPQGLMERVVTKKYGQHLIIHFLGRYDQIFFKLHAAADQSGGKHYDDLLALKPTAKEIEEASRWSITHDPSDGYRFLLKDFLTRIGFADVAAKL
ncbi:MAG: hypothetical protein WCC06_11790 [Candidatus Aminicenantales bacterium]